jgi:hypothetical protein
VGACPSSPISKLKLQRPESKRTFSREVTIPQFRPDLSGLFPPWDYTGMGELWNGKSPIGDMCPGVLPTWKLPLPSARTDKETAGASPCRS